MPVGVSVSATEIPAATINPASTSTAFIVGFADWGLANTATKITSLASFASQFASPNGSGNVYAQRTTGCATAFDAVETFFRESGTSQPTCYFSRVTHGSPVKATLVTNDGSANAALTFTAVYAGVGGNAINVVIVNNTTNYNVTLQDSAGNVLATSGTLGSLAAGVAWAATTGLVTAVAGANGMPATLTATPLASGVDNHGGATLADWTAALTSFGPGLGPGQVLAPGQTNTALSGIWSALGTHAQANNRVALCDMTDNESAATGVADIGTFGTGVVASYCGFWIGSRTIPGTTPGTTRTVAPSSVIAGLCARVDAGGNVNRAAAGSGYPLLFATQAASLVTGTLDTYSLADLNTLNAAGINTFRTIGTTTSENYGFVSAVPSSSDAIYWQINHARLRMSLLWDATAVGEPFVFSQLDGQGSDAIQFGSALQAMLAGYYRRGALYGASAQDAFSVDVSSNVNTTASIAAGQLNAQLTVRMSPFAQQVSITVNVVPVTQTV